MEQEELEPSYSFSLADFDKLIDRNGTNCVKWDAIDRSQRQDLIPLWVADMDFQVAQPIRNALCKAASADTFGYFFVPDSYYEAIAAWEYSRHQLDVYKRQE